MSRIVRTLLLMALAFVSVTALAGGVAIVAGSLDPDMQSLLVPPREYLDGSPFRSYLVPGFLLIVLVAGVHAAAFFAVLLQSRWEAILSAAAGFACLIWIFVQMIYIPFSALQVAYFGIGIVELSLTLVRLGALDALRLAHRSTFVPLRREREPHARG